MSNAELIYAEPAVTVCAPGRRSREIVRRADPDRPARTLLADDAVIPKDTRVIGRSHERYDASREATQTEIATLEVGTRQPHRRGASDPRSERLGTALGRFCERRDRGDARPAYALAHHLWLAGNTWHEVTRAYQLAIDLKIADRGVGNGENRDDDRVAANASLARRRRADAEEALIDIGLGRRPINAMDRLTIEDRDPYACDEGLLVHCLAALAKHFRLEPRTVRDGS